MAIPVIQEGDIGTVFVLEIRDSAGAVVDISTATTMDAIFRASPAAASVTHAGTFTTDGTDGKFQYTTTAIGDLTPAGDCWQIQAYVVIPGLGSFRSFVREFPVKPNL